MCVWIYSYKSELNYNFVSENQFYNQKLQNLASSRINSEGKINYTRQQPNMQNQFWVNSQLPPEIVSFVNYPLKLTKLQLPP